MSKPQSIQDASLMVEEVEEFLTANHKELDGTLAGERFALLAKQARELRDAMLAYEQDVFQGKV